MIVLTLAQTSAVAMKTAAVAALDRLTRAGAEKLTGHRIVFEVRLDRANDTSLAAEFAGFPRPILATLRSRDHGGDGPVDPVHRAEILARAAAWADFVDLEFPHDVDLVAKFGRRSILSLHALERPIEEVLSFVAAMHKFDVLRIKVATTAASIAELVRVLECADAHRDRASVFALGEIGAVSRWRLLARGPEELFFASADSRPAAPGQPTIDDLECRLPAVGAAVVARGPSFFALIGNPTAHSLSPVGYTAGFAALGRPYFYVTLPCRDIVGIERLAQLSPFRGFSVTAPHKIAAAQICRELSEVARAIGAVNTLSVMPDGSFRGENTDVDGVIAPLVAHFADRWPMGRRALLLGTGGAARAAAFAVRQLGFVVDVAARDRSAAEETAGHHGGRGFAIGEDPGIARWEVLLNGLPGEAWDELPVKFEAVVARAAVFFDMNYRRTGRRLVELAEKFGKPIIPGIEMFLAQGVRQLGILVSDDPAASAAFRRAVLASFSLDSTN